MTRAARAKMTVRRIGKIMRSGRDDFKRRIRGQQLMWSRRRYRWCAAARGTAQAMQPLQRRDRIGLAGSRKSQDQSFKADQGRPMKGHLFRTATARREYGRGVAGELAVKAVRYEHDRQIEA